MGLFQEWLRARMYRKQITKGIKEALDQPEKVDMSDMVPTGQKTIIFRNVVKAKKEDVDDIYDIMYEILKEDLQQIDKSSIKKSKPHKINISIEKKFTRGEMELIYELKPLKNKLILTHKAEIKGWGRSWYPDQIKEFESSFNELTKSIEDIAS